MSYCRWSTDDYQCDLYVYESNRGIEVRVACGRYAYKDPLPELVELADDNFAEWFSRNETIRRMIKEADLVSIGLPHDGECHTFDTGEEAAEYCEKLMAMGYQAPADLPKWLRDEDE